MQAPCSSSGSRWPVWAGRRGRGGAWRCWTWSSRPGIYQSIYLYLQSLYLHHPPSPSEPRAPGHVVLVAGGCRVPEFSHLVPRPPRAVPRPQLEAGTEAELRLQLEAVMLDVAR